MTGKAPVAVRAVSAGGRALLSAPPPLLRALGGPERRNDRGDVLDPQVQVLLRLSDLLRFPKTHEQSPAEARATTDRQALLVEPHPVRVARVENQVLTGRGGDIPLRVYIPRRTKEPLPVLVYFHGGGFCIGSLASHDGPCRALAAGADCIVVAVDYRLAPEHPFPAALEDCVAAFGHVVERAASYGGDPTRIAVGGDSAGGNLAAVVSQHQREAAGPRPVFQLLIYPATDLTRSHESHELFARGFFLEADTKDWFTDNYIGTNVDRQRDPRVSPLFADRFDDLPPALVVTAGFDPLRDEGEAYAEKMRANGVPVLEQREGSLVHGFLNMVPVRCAAAARAEMIRALRTALHG